MALHPEPKEWPSSATMAEIERYTAARRVPLVAHPAALRERWRIQEDGRKQGPEMPEGMTYENDTWTVHGAGMSWKFEAAEGPSPPGIVRTR